MTGQKLVPEAVEAAAIRMYEFMRSKDDNPTQGERWDNIYPEVRDSLRDLARVALAASPPLTVQGVSEGTGSSCTNSSGGGGR